MQCQECQDDVDELIPVKVGRKTRKLCEDCAERVQEADAVAGEAESNMQKMMEYKGRRT
ncbi:MAG: hypothetical protein IPK13_06420 [Deltaproteobacteria bacterium]|nr:hypothetical protein [Deltaproteobacteria bacterium]